MIKPIAFYLPQYHPIPENNRWWGEGFTEWDNVRSVVPQFSGHYQPHVPHASIGYYDLRNVLFMKKQHAIARKYGIYGFCYYYYDFNGKIMLDAPLVNILENKDIDINFCLCWANGDWTRAWYGQNKEVLISNHYSFDSAYRFIEKILPYFSDERYIKIDGKPLLLVYEAEAIPDCKNFSLVWRRIAQNSGFPGLCLASVEALLIGSSPDEYGFDCAVEFAPDWTKVFQVSQKKDSHRIFDYKETVKNMLFKPEVSYDRYRCVFPSWDNAPRYKQSAITFVNASPGIFKYFLKATIEKTRLSFPEDRQFFFINAWNEWGEGCHMEPDKKYGYAYLQVLKETILEDEANTLSLK